jgi:multiple sugar transport system ATP-binding protein
VEGSIHGLGHRLHGYCAAMRDGAHRARPAHRSSVVASVQLNGVRKSFGRHEVVHGVDVSIDDGEFVVLVGPSGCGKSTLLRMIAGLEEISAGEILIGNKVVNKVPPKARDVAMVFQNYALYPHMTVLENMAFSMMLAGKSKEEVRERVDHTAKILGLSEYLDRYPRQLSGGQRQRVAMGRAIVRDPQVFLFDEPLSNLDAKLRVQMRTEIKALHQRLKTTSVYVTHDQIEAMTMADKIVVMNGGHVEQIGSPLKLYDDPTNLFVAGFIGSPAMNFLSGVLQRDGAQCQVVLADGQRIPLSELQLDDGHQVTLGVRPEHLLIAEQGVPAEVTIVEPTGADTQVYCKLAGVDVTVVSRDRHAVRPGDVVRLQTMPGKTYLFDTASGKRLV